MDLKTLKNGKVSHPKRILPKYFRDDPFAEPPPITEDDIADGMLNLLNRGIIPKDVDLSPAFERGIAPFQANTMSMKEKDKFQKPQAVKPVKALPYKTMQQ